MINYEGLFFEGEELEKILSLEETKLDIINDLIHCTFKYKPNDEETFDELVGKYFNVTLFGYACDGNNSGFLVLIDKKIEKYYKNTNQEGKIIPPHITCSIAKDASALKTSDLVFNLLKNPIIIKGKFGYYIKEENGKSYVSYKPFKTNK